MRIRPSRLLAIALALFVTLTAAWGGVLLIADPTGGAMHLSLDLLTHAPFGSYLVPGLVLAGVVGGSHAVAAGLAALGHPRGHRALQVAGLLLGGWIVVQIALIRELHGFQFAYLGVAIAELVLGAYHPARVRPGMEYAIREFLGAHRVAFIGLSADDKDFSRTVARAMSEHGMGVIPVNARAAMVGSDKAWARLSDMQDPPKVAFVMTPASAALSVVDDCQKAGVTTVWFHRGVGAGAGTPEAIAAAREAGMVVISDVCPLMFLEPVKGIHHVHKVWRIDESRLGNAGGRA